MVKVLNSIVQRVEQFFRSCDELCVFLRSQSDDAIRTPSRRVRGTYGHGNDSCQQLIFVTQREIIGIGQDLKVRRKWTDYRKLEHVPAETRSTSGLADRVKKRASCTYPGGKVSRAAFVAVVCSRRIGCPIDKAFQE